jgi:hypothetical protein
VSRKVERPIRVEESTQGPQGHPVSFYWSGRWNRVDAVIDSWRECGEWWDGAEEHDYFLVSSGSGCYELSRTCHGQWELSRIID